MVVGTQRGIVTPAAGRSPLITETQLFSAAFFVRTVDVGLPLSVPPLPEPPQAAITDAKPTHATTATTRARDVVIRNVDIVISPSTLGYFSQPSPKTDARSERRLELLVGRAVQSQQLSRQPHDVHLKCACSGIKS